MGVMQAALEGVGFKPTIRPRDLRRLQERQAVTESLEKALDGVFAPLIKERKVRLQYAGDFYRARFDGMRNNYFGRTAEEATERLNLWGDEQTTKGIEVNEDGN